MPIDPKQLETITKLAELLQHDEANLDNVGDLANAVPELLAEVERLQELVAAARHAMVDIGRGSDDPDNAELVDAVTNRYDEVLALLQAERDLSRFGWSEEDFEKGGVTIE